jgi:hypothetical protein
MAPLDLSVELSSASPVADSTALPPMPRGPIGPVGPTGPAGSGVSVLGSYATLRCTTSSSPNR